MTSILLILLLSLAGDSLSARLPYIIKGGEVPDILYWPWQGSLRRLFGEHTCGCSLISATWAVTAASCVQSPPYEVSFGDKDRTKGKTRPVAEIRIHENYEDRANKPNDIAVIRFATITMGEKINKVKLARTNEESNSNCWITGWGFVGVNTHGTFPNILRQAQMHPTTLETCRIYWGDSVKDEHFCAMSSAKTGGLCGGDFGGPLVCHVGASYQLVGISSWADNRCDKSYPSVFTRITSFRAWIDTITGVQ